MNKYIIISVLEDKQFILSVDASNIQDAVEKYYKSSKNEIILIFKV